MAKPVHIVYCDCSYSEIISQAVKRQVRRELGRLKGASVNAVADLCGSAVRNDPMLTELAKEESVKIIACHPRAVKWLLAKGQQPPAEEKMEIFNMRKQTAEEIVRSLREAGCEQDGPLSDDCGFSKNTSDGCGCCKRDTADEVFLSEIKKDGGWIPWFPVIDYQRCNDCRQCLNFCLFDVFGVSQGGQIEVQRPQNCKTNCPACARVCPQGAIIFPKHPTGPINGGEAEQGDEPQVDLSALSGEDIYAMLRRRSGKSKEELTAIYKCLCNCDDNCEQDNDDSVASEEGFTTNSNCKCSCDCGDDDKGESHCC